MSFDDTLTQALLRAEPRARFVTRAPVTRFFEDAVGRRARLAFETPAHFRARGGGLPFQLPDPHHLFGGLVERWRALGLPALDAPDLRRIGVAPERLVFEVPWHDAPRARDGQRTFPQTGFLGVATYDLVALEPADQAAAWALLRFAEWRGVGRHTSYGCGRVRLLARDEHWDAGQRRMVWDEG